MLSCDFEFSTDGNKKDCNAKYEFVVRNWGGDYWLIYWSNKFKYQIA